MLEIIRKFEDELRRKAKVVLIEQKESFNQGDLFTEDLNFKRGFYLIPENGGKVSKIEFGYTLLRDFPNENFKVFYHFDTDSLEILNKYKIKIPKVFLQ